MDEFILGFIAGEGSFHVSLLERKSGLPGYRPVFKVGVNEEEIIYRIHNHLKLGNVYNEEDMYVWQMQSVDDLITLCYWIEENKSKTFECTKKHEQYKKWKKAVEIKESNKNKKMSVENQKKMIDISYSIPDSNTKKVSKEDWYKKAENNKLYYCNEQNYYGEKCMITVESEEDTCRHH
jgi:hypothetical protein